MEGKWGPQVEWHAQGNAQKKSVAELGLEPSMYATFIPVVLPGMERIYGYIRALVKKGEEKG